MVVSAFLVAVVMFMMVAFVVVVKALAVMRMAVVRVRTATKGVGALWCHELRSCSFSLSV